MAYGRTCFRWAMKRKAVKDNPFADHQTSHVGTDRDRVLTDAEIEEIVPAVKAMPYPWGPFYRLALLTLQRRDEVAGMRWSELSEELSMWTISGARMKNGKPHDVQLAQPARAILRSIPRVAKRDLVFTRTGKTPVSTVRGPRRRSILQLWRRAPRQRARRAGSQKRFRPGICTTSAARVSRQWQLSASTASLPTRYLRISRPS